jgi:hypothetical protein
VRIAPVVPAKGLFASPVFPPEAHDGFNAVVYNSLVVDPESE